MRLDMIFESKKARYGITPSTKTCLDYWRQQRHRVSLRRKLSGRRRKSHTGFARSPKFSQCAEETFCKSRRVIIHTIAADLQIASTGEEVLNQAEKHFGPVDILVNSAGAAKRTPPEELTPDVWHAAMRAKYFSYIHMTDPTIKRMGQRGSGAIVNVIGAGGKIASPIHMPGGAANAALMLANAGMASAYASKGVRVNAVNPGLTLTDRLQEGMTADAKAQGITEAEAMQRANTRIPMGRMAKPSEIADAVVFLASSRASYITGVSLTMDGCMTPVVF